MEKKNENLKHISDHIKNNRLKQKIWGERKSEKEMKIIWLLW